MTRQQRQQKRIWTDEERAAINENAKDHFESLIVAWMFYLINKERAVS